jgi:hypothetical protein
MMGIKNRSFGPLLLVTLVQTGTGPSVASRRTCSWSHTATITAMSPPTGGPRQLPQSAPRRGTHTENSP